MKNKQTMGNLNDKEWERLASELSGENNGDRETDDSILPGDAHEIKEKWKGLKEMSDDKEINVDKAWDKLSSRLKEAGSFEDIASPKIYIMRSTFVRIAASAILLVAIGGAAKYLDSKGFFRRQIVAATGQDQKNEKITLPDGSTAILNRSSRLAYSSAFNKTARRVTLRGEAFFEITPDKNNPFIIDAGSASIKVLGTAFNVITSNPESAVEVYVESGRVMLSDNTGSRQVVLDPGYIGTMNALNSGKKLNSNPNYMAWNSGRLVYDGQTLDIVFRDLKRVYNMDIVADDPGILKETWTSPIDNQTPETIIRLICTSFNLGYYMDGNVFHLSKK